MDANRATALLIRGMLLEQPQAVRDAVLNTYDELRAIVDKAGGPGLLALALLGAEKSTD